AVQEGRPPALAYALAALALVLLEADRPREALAEAERAMAILEGLSGIEEGDAMIRLTHARALHAAGEEARARDAIGDAKARVFARAERIGDSELRRAFLEDERENRRTLALARAWHVA